MDGWSDGGQCRTRFAHQRSDLHTASFKTQHLLTTSAGGGRTVSPASGYYDASQSVSIRATANGGTASLAGRAAFGILQRFEQPGQCTMMARFRKRRCMSEARRAAGGGVGHAGWSWVTEATRRLGRGRTGVTHDGMDAAQSGAIGNSQATWMETR